MASTRSQRRGVEEEDEKDEFMVEKRERSRMWRGNRCFGLFMDNNPKHDPIGEESTELGSRRNERNWGHLASERFIIDPDNWWYAIVWTHFILIWAIYSSFFTPLEFGFFRGLPKNLFLLDIAGQLAFLVDMVVHFFVAYRDSNSYRIVHNRKLIAFSIGLGIANILNGARTSEFLQYGASIRPLGYMKSRFVIDFLGCLPWDAIFKASGRKEPVRYLLWIRLSRASRVTEFFERLEKDIRINYLFTRIVKLFVVELYWTHAAACMFYYLATTMPPSKEGYTWIGSLKLGDYSYSHFRDIDLWKRYVTSLYFAIVTMATVGYGDIHAVNVREMIFLMIYVSFDMILGAYLLGNMTALIVKGSRTEKFRDKMADLMKYLNNNNLGNGIGDEIKRHLRLQYNRSYSETTILKDIPASVRAQISEKLYEPYIKEAPLFKGCSSGFIKQMANKVLEEFFLPGQVIIEEGHVVNHLYIVCHGELEEIRRGEDDEKEDNLGHLQAYSSFGEVSLLCNTPQPYTVRVKELCRVLRLDKQYFIEILEFYFPDGRIVLTNLLEGKDSASRKELLESDAMLHIEKSETELAARVNCAVNDGDLYRLKRFIAAGASPSKADYFGRSPLHTAVCKGYEDITIFLIEQGADVNCLDKCGNTPLYEAIKNGHDVLASLLVKAGALLEVENVGFLLCDGVAKRDSAFLKRILDIGLNPNAKNYDYRTPLHIAASEGLYSIAKLLLEAGANVSLSDRWGRTPLDEARVSGNKNLIQLLHNAKTLQLSEISNYPAQFQDEACRRKCTVFPFHPRDREEKRQHGIVLWVPQTMDELALAAVEQLKYSSYCILSENGGKIVDVSMINNDQNLFLVEESTMEPS